MNHGLSQMMIVIKLWWTGGQSQDLVGDSGVNNNNGEKIIIVMP